MRRWISLGLGALAVLPVQGTSLSALQPNSTEHAPAELLALKRGLAALCSLLDGPTRRARRYSAEGGWESRSFAAYAASALASLGQDTRLVAAPGWTDGTHTRVLAGIWVGARIAWIPVEATPPPGRPQETLGTIPSFVDAAGRLCLEVRYTQLAEEICLPANEPPRAALRVVPAVPRVGEKVTFSGRDSVNSDGEIIRYVWAFGDGTRFEARDVERVFPRAATYCVILTVVDSRGASASAAATVVVSAAETQPTSPNPGCGCGRGW